jgi:hypothetical protein
MSQAPEDGCFNIRNILNIKKEMKKWHQVGLSLLNDFYKRRVT